MKNRKTLNWKITAMVSVFVMVLLIASYGYAVVYTNLIDTSKPAGTDDPREADDNMRRIQAGFQEILDKTHDFELTGTIITGTGYHKTPYDVRIEEGVDPTGVTDSYAAIQAALDSGASKVIMPHGDYKVSQPVRVDASVQLVGESSSSNSGTIIFPDLSVDWAVAFPDRGVIETRNFDWPTGYPGGSVKPDFWHWGSIENLQVKCNKDPLFATFPARVPDYGIVIWAAGEQSLLRRTQVTNATKANYLLGGFMAVLQVEDCGGSNSGSGYGVTMTNHPNINFAPGVSSRDGGRGNGGSIRFIGFSGDGNPLGLLHADGTQIVDCIGLKSESQEPAITIGGSSAANARQRWSITGYRHEAGASVGDFLRIDDTAKPQVFIGPGQCANSVNLLNDTVSSVVIPKQAEGFILFYDRDQDYQVRSRFGTFPGSAKFQSNVDGDGAQIEVAWGGDGSPDTTSRRTTLDVRNAVPAIRRYTGLAASKRIIWSVDFASTGDNYMLYAYNGTDTEAIVNMDSNGDTASVSIGLDPAQKVGFYGTTPVIQQSVTDLNTLLIALDALGIIVDGR